MDDNNTADSQQLQKMSDIEIGRAIIEALREESPDALIDGDDGADLERDWILIDGNFKFAKVAAFLRRMLLERYPTTR